MEHLSTTTAADRQARLMRLTSALASLQRHYRAAADKCVAHLGLSQALAGPLVMIGRQAQSPRPGLLADLLGIEGPSLARSLDQLVRAELVMCREDPADRRAKTLHLTPAGSAARHQIEAVLTEYRTRLFDGIADADVEACLRVFDTIGQRLSAHPPEQPQADATASGAAPSATASKPPTRNSGA